MKDLTKGPITGHLLAMAAPMAIGMLVQTLYFMVDLYFVSRLGATALAGVSAAGSVGRSHPEFAKEMAYAAAR